MAVFIQTMKSTKFLALLLGLLILTSCNNGKTAPQAESESPSKHATKLINEGAFVIDVRSQEEFQTGHLPQAVNIPHDQIAERLLEVPAAKDRSIVVYCKSGRRAGIAKTVLESKGYTNVTNAGGYEELMK